MHISVLQKNEQIFIVIRRREKDGSFWRLTFVGVVLCLFVFFFLLISKRKEKIRKE
jgi:hypothetical protein